MALTINDDAITGDNTSHIARPAPGRPGVWEVSWLPGRLLDRYEAVTAMILADIAATTTADNEYGRWPHIQGWANELGLSAPDALARISHPGGDPTAGRQDPEPEAAG